MTCKSLPGMNEPASTLSCGWQSVNASLFEGKPTSEFGVRSEEHVIAFLLKGSAKVEWKSPGRFLRFFASPGSFTIIPAGTVNEFWIDRPVTILVLKLSVQTLDSLARTAWSRDDASVELTAAANKRDSEIWSMGQKIAGFLSDPIKGAQLYVESLQTQLALQLLWNYSSLRPREVSVSEGLDEQRFKRVLEYIQSSLGEELSLNELASVAGYSPNYFLGAFKRATGRSPHIYLTEQRIARACELLQNPHKSIVSVALEVGFSSQSHFTSVFRRLRKTTPAAFRREVLGLTADDAVFSIAE